MQRYWIITFFIIVATLCFLGRVCAEEVELEEVVVTATRIPIPQEETGSSVTVITEKEIKAKGYTTVKETLKGTMGLDVVSTGGPGANTSIFLRGANSYHTLVLIDGMKIGDPSLMQRQFNSSNLTVDNIERIEIVRGAQSVLYGADAMGGVINIVTKKGEKKPYLYLGAEGGSYSTARQFAGVGVANDQADFSFAFSHIRSEGFSAADADLPGNEEDDGWENFTVSSRLGVAPTEWLNMGVSLRMHDGRTDLDGGGWSYQDVEDYYLNRTEVFVHPYIKVKAFDGLWEQSLAYGFTTHSRAYKNDPYGDSEYDGEKHEISWQHNLYLHKTNTLTVGLEYEKEAMKSTAMNLKSAYTYSLFAQDQIKLFDISFTTVGVRWDHHQEFGDYPTFRVTQAFVFDKLGTTVKGSLGTGFRAPSLYELYGPPFFGMPVGNPDLDPEKSIGWDAGAEQSLFNERMKVGATYFHNEFDDLIKYMDGQGYVNIDNAETEGVEAFIEVLPFKDLSARVMYTYTHTDDDQGNPLLRRPEHKAGLNLCYRFLDERGTVNVDLLYVGERDDIANPPWPTPSFRTELDDYVVVNISGSFKIHKYVEVFARIENLFDEDYEEAFGYGAPGVSAYGGVTLTFF